MFKPQNASSVNHVPSTYMDQLLQGEVLLEDIDDFVDAWHDAPDDSEIASQTLDQFLGMTEEEYRLWVERPESLRFIAAAHKMHKPVATVLSSRNRYGLAARAREQGEAQELLQWLIEHGRVKRPPL